MKEFIRNLIVEGSRVLWTGVQAAAGVLAAFNLPDPTWAGAYAPGVKGAVAVTVAMVVTKLKEAARLHLSGA